MSFQLDNEAFDDACDDYCLYAPPPLCHQRSIEFPGSSYSFQDEVVDTELVYRSISLAGTQAVLDDYCTDTTSALIDGSYDYSSPHTNDSCLWESELPLAYDRSLSISDSLCSSDAGYASYCTAAHLYMHPVQSQNAPSKVTELPPELFDLVLQHLSTSPDLFIVMCTCRAWRDAARVQYAARTIFVPAEPDALLRAVRAAAPGETIRLLPGVHMLSEELTVDRPLRLLGPGADDAVGSVNAAGCASDASHANCSCGAECVTGVSDVSGGGGGGDGCGVVCARDAVLCSPKHVVIRTRSSTCLSRLTLCRLGDDVGYPNTVVFAEASRLFLDGCRITCGGGATSVAEALHAFDGFAHPAHALDACACPAAQQGGCRPPVDSQRLDRPQAGVWVGAAASVFMTRNLISCTMGPGIKVYRGTLEAEGNTVAYSCRGANVVANGGKVRLVRNVIRSAFGDGISSWNDAEMRVEANHIHSNTGSGVAINSVGGEVRITDNYVFDNAKSAVLFVTSQAQQAVLSGNMMLEQNGGGGVQGLRQHHKARGRMLTPMHCAPVAPRRDVFDASLSMET